MLFKRKDGGIVEAKNNYEASILMSNKDYTPFENEKNEENIEENVDIFANIEENSQNEEKNVKKSSKKKDGE